MTSASWMRRFISVSQADNILSGLVAHVRSNYFQPVPSFSN
jgi:hypothetical protein